MELLFSCGAFAGGDIFASCTTREGSHGDFILSFSGFGNGFTGIEPATCGWVDKGKGDDLHAPKDENNDDKWECVDGIYSLEFDGIPKGAKVLGTGSFVATPEPMTAVLLLGGLAGVAGLRKRRNS